LSKLSITKVVIAVWSFIPPAQVEVAWLLCAILLAALAEAIAKLLLLFAKAIPAAAIRIVVLCERTKVRVRP